MTRLRFPFNLTGMLAVIVMAGLLSGCGDGSSGDNGAVAKEKVYNYVNTDEPKNLDPVYSYDYFEGFTNGLIFDGLVNFGEGSDLIPGIAESWEVSEDRTTFVFTLRKNAKFSDGRPVTSKDVVYSYNRLVSPETASDRKNILDKIAGYDEVVSGTATALAGLTTPDAHTVEIRLKAPYPPFLTKIAMPAAAIIPEGSAADAQSKREFNTKPTGTGPWVLREWKRDLSLEFVPNPHYWGDPPKIDRLMYHVQAEDRTMREMFKVGHIDQYAVGFTGYLDWASDPELKKLLHRIPELNTYFLAFNHTKPHLQDVRVRKAITHAINRPLIFEKIQLSRGILAHGPVPPGIEGYREDLPVLEYNPDKARALLKEAGVDNLTVQLWLKADAQNDEIMAAVKSDLEAVGINAEVVRRDLSALREAIYNAQTDMYYYSWWLDYPDIENALEPTLHSRNIPRQGNGSHFSNPDFDAAIEMARQESDPAKRIELFQKAEDIAIEQCAWVPIFHRESYVAVQPWIKNFSSNLMINAEKYLTVDVDLSMKK